jgi:L-ascorbate peroxidase
MEKMQRMGFTREEFVAIMGSHTIGFAHEDRSGFKGRWTQNPHVFDNTYFKEVLLGEKTRFLRTHSEIMLYESPDLKAICEQFAQDENLFFEKYANAHVKMSEFGQEENLLSEFEPNKMKTGGYMESNDFEEEETGVKTTSQ